MARAPREDVQLTRSGAVVGTPAFMAPEQARAAEKVDPAMTSDLFSLGCVLYRLCTAQMPFKGDTTMALLMSLAMDHPTPVHEINPEMPAELADLVMRLLAKAPAERPASAREVIQEIQAIERRGPGKGEPDAAPLPSGTAAGASRLPEPKPQPMPARPQSCGDGGSRRR